MSKLSLVGGDAGIGEVLLHAPETDETRIYEFPDETGTFALREVDIKNLDDAKANRAGDTFTGDVHFDAKVTIQAPTDNNHAATKKYVDDNITELTETVNEIVEQKLVLATAEEAKAGTDAMKLMTPATTKEAILTLAPQPDLSPYYLKSGGAISGAVTISGATQINNSLTVTGTIVTGTAKAQTFQSTSDVRLKDGLEKIDSVPDKLDRIHLYRYNFNDNDQVKHLGLIAQEVVRVFPELVSKDDNGYLAIDYNGMTAVLLQAVKELGKELAQK